MRLFVIGFAVTLCLLLGMLSTCAAGPAKATGAGDFVRIEEGETLTARVEFNAHAAVANRPAKGMLQYSDSHGMKFTVEVQCAEIYSYYANFAGPVVKTNDPDLEGQWLAVWVMDGGSPAEGNDMIGGQMYDHDPGCVSGSTPFEWWPVENGNIAVHPSAW